MVNALTSRLPLDHCPRCQHKLDSATSMEFCTPEVGHLTVCIQCGTILQWNQSMRLEMFDLSDLKTIPTEALVKIMNIVAAIGYVKPRARHQRN